MEYPFDLDRDTSIQPHTIGMSIINALCKERAVTVHKKDGTYIQVYKNGRLHREESRENPNTLTGTSLSGQFDPERIHDTADQQDMEQWLRKVKSINSQLTLIFNGKEL